MLATVLGKVRRAVGRLIPDDTKRSAWWLTVGASLTVSFAGLAASVVVLRVLGVTGLLEIAGRFLAINLSTFAVVIAVAGWYLSRSRHPFRGWRLVAYALSVGLMAVGLRLALAPLMGSGGTEDLQPVALALQMVNVVIFTFALAVALGYASIREHRVDELYAALSRAQVGLAREEEAVRGRVFDELHGTLQTTFVTMQRNLLDLAERTDDPDAERRARRMADELQRTYRQEVGAVAASLLPRGLDAGLRPALADLQARVGHAAEITVELDTVVLALDDPTRAGIHHDLRLCVYRIVEEGVSNALRHASARAIRVVIRSTLTEGRPGLVCEVSHHVTGLVEIRPGAGLERMAARAQALGGHAEWCVSEDEVLVRAELPLTRPDEGRWSV